MAREMTTMSDLMEVVRRRRWDIIVPAVVVFLVAALVAFSLPKKYRSTATILIEAQEVPSEYVKANISSFADQRIQTINQQIMGAPRLLEMIHRFNLYADLKGRSTVEEIVDKMRKDIKLTPISADVVDPRSGRPAQATIAFSISFQGRNPEVVQQVANELSSLYVAENLKGRDKQSAGTYRFLQEEMNTIKGSLSAIEERISRFKQQNIDALPELSQVNLQAFDQVDREIRVLNDQLRGAREKEEYLQQQLAGVPKELSSNAKESLRQLKLTLVDLKSRFSDHYPDVKKVKYEIAELEGQLKSMSRDAGESPDNPAYVTLAAQLAGTRTDIESLKRQIAEMVAKRAIYQRRIQSSPRVEEGYKAILVERSNLQQKYDDLAKKAMEANVAHGMEKEQLGERFTLVDPARLPQKPTSPNVPAILLIGMILGIGSGAGLAAIKESVDDTVRVADELSKLTGFTVLATIPEIPTPRDLVGKKKKRLVAACAVAIVAVLGAAAVHVFVMDLEVLWTKAGRALGW